MNFEAIIFELKTELNLKYLESKYKEKSFVKSDEKRLELIKKIETIIFEILTSIANNQPPVFKTITHDDWNNCVFKERVNLNEERKKTRIINFGREASRSKFSIIVFLLSKIHNLLTTRQTNTRRELYYKNLQMFRSQNQVDRNMIDVCYILNASTWELGILATSKGIVFGPVLLFLSNGECIDCSQNGGVSVPTNAFEIEKISTSATWIMIIEKDASFQALIANEAATRLNCCIFVTGKGYPDVNTRILISKFWEHLRIPILALVDADPHGFEIMCVYRFGSVTMSSYSEHMACPAVRWVGVHPADIKPLLLDSKNLTLKDVQKIHTLMQRFYVKENENFKNQLEILLKGNVKAEIEDISSISTHYLTDVYVKNKILCKEFF